MYKITVKRDEPGQGQTSFPCAEMHLFLSRDCFFSDFASFANILKLYKPVNRDDSEKNIIYNENDF